jgi:hypothetical protein
MHVIKRIIKEIYTKFDVVDVVGSCCEMEDPRPQGNMAIIESNNTSRKSWHTSAAYPSMAGIIHQPKLCS